MLCIVAYHGLKARCIAVLLHTRMSHTGRTTSGWTSVLRRPEWNGDFEPDISALKGCCVPFGTRSATTEPEGETSVLTCLDDGAIFLMGHQGFEP